MKLRRKIGEQEVVVECGDDLEAQGQALLNKMVELNERGPALKDNIVIEFGWAPIKLREEDDALVAYEPDFDGNALQDFVRGVDRVLRVLKWQISLLNSLGLKGDSVRYNQKLVLLKGSLQLRRIYLQREKASRDDDSGWYIGDENRPEAHDNVSELEGIYIYELLKLRPAVMKVLALPPDYLVLMEGDEPESIFDPDGSDLWAV